VHTKDKRVIKSEHKIREKSVCAGTICGFMQIMVKLKKEVNEIDARGFFSVVSQCEVERLA
jgi:hypothetical protein